MEHADAARSTNLRIVADTGQISAEYHRLLLQAKQEYLEFARPPYAVDPAREPLVAGLRDQGIKCRLLFDSQSLMEQNPLNVLQEAGAQVRLSAELPLKLALFDNESGMISLDDPVVSHPQITALVFEHHSLSTAMHSLFNDYWKRGTKV